MAQRSFVCFVWGFPIRSIRSLRCWEPRSFHITRVCLFRGVLISPVAAVAASFKGIDLLCLQTQYPLLTIVSEGPLEKADLSCHLLYWYSELEGQWEEKVVCPLFRKSFGKQKIENYELLNNVYFSSTSKRKGEIGKDGQDGKQFSDGSFLHVSSYRWDFSNISWLLEVFNYRLQIRALNWLTWL